jgi:hypothetical protein
VKKYLLTLLATVAAGAVMAEAPPYATIIDAQGLSTVSVGNQLLNAAPGMKLVQGAQLLTSASSAMTVSFAGGCNATIKAGQSLNVNLADCKSFVAQQGAAKQNLASRNIGSGAAAGGLAGGIAAGGFSAATVVAVVGAALVVTGVVADATASARYVSVANPDGTFTVTDRKTNKTAIVSAAGVVLSAS